MNGKTWMQTQRQREVGDSEEQDWKWEFATLSYKSQASISIMTSTPLSNAFLAGSIYHLPNPVSDSGLGEARRNWRRGRAVRWQYHHQAHTKPEATWNYTAAALTVARL